MQQRTGYPKVEVTERWNGCLLVNPLCPDDLCWLPAEGGKQHLWHCLGTDRWCDRFTIGDTAFYMSKTSTTAAELIHEGWIKQLRMSPDEAEFRRQTNPDLYYEAFPERRSDWGRGRPPTPAPNPRGKNVSHRSSLLNRTGGNKKKLFPCWCGESLVGRYRQMAVCCVDYLAVVGPWVYLGLESVDDNESASAS